METDQLPDHIVYSKNVIEFVTVAAESCLFLEHAEALSRTEFVEKSIKLLPLLYLKTLMVTVPAAVYEDGVEHFVTEDDYLFVRRQVEQILGPDDSYLEVFHPDMALSDTPIAVFVSENMADVYQELKDFAANFQLGDVDIMNDALVACLESFAEHWGQKVLNALRALHALRFSDGFGTDETEDGKEHPTKIDRNSFLQFLHDEEGEEEFNDLLK